MHSLQNTIRQSHWWSYRNHIILDCFRHIHKTEIIKEISVQARLWIRMSHPNTNLISISIRTVEFKVSSTSIMTLLSNPATRRWMIGTNKPAHYYVLVDENGFGSDGIQLLSYWMCYLYCRCTRSVSYAPPAYYAHLAALHGRYVVGHHTDSSSEGSNGKNGAMFHEGLNERMFFV